MLLTLHANLVTYRICTFGTYFSCTGCDILSDAPDILETIARLKTDLTNIVEPDFGLLDALLRLGVLTRPELADAVSYTHLTLPTKRIV